MASAAWTPDLVAPSERWVGGPPSLAHLCATAIGRLLPRYARMERPPSLTALPQERYLELLAAAKSAKLLD